MKCCEEGVQKDGSRVRRRLDAEYVREIGVRVSCTTNIASLYLVHCLFPACGEHIKKLTDEELKEKIKYLMRSMERFVPMDTEKESRKRTGVELQTKSSKKLKSDTKEDVSVPKEKDKEIANKPESVKSGTEEDVEAYMEERVDEPSSEEFPMSSIPQGPTPAKIVKWQIIKTGKRGAYQIIREDNTDVVYVNFPGLLNDLTRDDLKELYRLMMLKYGDNRPEEEFERVLWGDLRLCLILPT
ncbi:hypothetical protein Tco_1255299 [Tanacetum coccineum]